MGARPGWDEYRAVADFRSALREFLRASENVTRAHGLTPGHYDLLVMVKAAVGGGATMSSLAERLAVAPNSATELVDRAEAAGLVRRRPDPVDGRVTRVSPTRAGDARIAAAVAELQPQRLHLLDLLTEVGERLRPAIAAGSRRRSGAARVD